MLRKLHSKILSLQCIDVHSSCSTGLAALKAETLWMRRLPLLKTPYLAYNSMVRTSALVQISLAQKYCELELWHAKLVAIAAAAGLDLTLQLRDALPLRGGQTVVFKLGQSAILKVYAKETQVSAGIYRVLPCHIRAFSLPALAIAGFCLPGEGLSCVPFFVSQTGEA